MGNFGPKDQNYNCILQLFLLLQFGGTKREFVFSFNKTLYNLKRFFKFMINFLFKIHIFFLEFQYKFNIMNVQGFYLLFKISYKCALIFFNFFFKYSFNLLFNICNTVVEHISFARVTSENFKKILKHKCKYLNWF